MNNAPASDKNKEESHVVLLTKHLFLELEKPANSEEQEESDELNKINRKMSLT